MKTKIIYISGSEVFEMADVRAAFDEVRSALGLGRDTVLFGVPVDNDDALAAPRTATAVVEIAQDAVPTDTDTLIAEEIEGNISPIVEEPDEPTPIVEEIKEPEAVQAPVKKSRGRPRKTAAAPAATAIEPEAPTASDEKVIPILSVLAANAATAEEEPAADAAAMQIDAAPAEAVAVETDSAPQPNAATDDAPIMASVETVSIDDMIADQAPEEPAEKTLEQLLESMTPLREDHGEHSITESDDAEPIVDIEDEPTMPAADTDATLEQLAAEFANTEDKIAAPAPTMSQGKIGKLKNILPFKKARREDTGLMGDLFGWAGVAANDEDFSIPGFFTTAASKK